MIEAPLPTMPAMLLDKKADLISAVLPFALKPELNEMASRCSTRRSARHHPVRVLDRAQSLIDKNRAAMVDFMEDMLRITRWYLDPKNHDEVVQIAGSLSRRRPRASAGRSPSKTPIATPI